MQEKMKQQSYYDRAVHSLPPLQPSQYIQIYDKKVGRWQRYGTVLGQVAQRSNSVQTQDGDIYKRNG